MAILLKNALIDGLTSWEMGVDTYRAPSRVPRNQLCLSVNNTTRQDYIGIRPAWKQVPLRFTSLSGGMIVPDPNLQLKFETGLFQKFHGYIPDKGTSYLVFAIAGELYKVDPLGAKSVEALKMPGPWPTRQENIWLQQAEQFLIVQDGQSNPIIFDGALLRFSNVLGSQGTDADKHPLVEVPAGGPMAYSEGRLWVTLPNGYSFVAGDGVYGPTGTARYQKRDAILRFTENTYLNGGGAFSVPANGGPIRSMVTMANLDTSLGQGPLQVFTSQGVFSVAAPFNREDWASLQNPIKTTSLLGNGGLSDASCVNVNGDVWYRGQDGVYSFLIARRDFGSWGNRSMSYEVVRHLQSDDKNLLFKSSGAYFDNRLLMTCAPFRDNSHGIFHRGLVVLDFIPLTSIGGSTPPVWDGLWCNLDVQQIATVESQGVTRCYAAVLAPLDNTGARRLQLWELSLGQGNDIDAYGTEIRSRRVIETPRLDFSPVSNRLEQKLLEACDIWHDKASGTIDLTLSFKPDESPCWYFWKSWQLCAPTKACAADAVDGCINSAMNRQRGYFTRVNALKPPEATTPYKTPARLAYAYQLRLEIQGDIEITAIRVLGKRIEEATFGAPGNGSCEAIIQCCAPPDFDPAELPSIGPIPNPAPTPPIPPPPPPVPPVNPDDPTGGFPSVNGWTSDWAYQYQSGYGMTKVTDSLVTDGMTSAKAAFWASLITQEWDQSIFKDTPYSERILTWTSVDPFVSEIGDFAAKYATGNPDPSAPDNPPLYSPGAYWCLAFIYR